MKLSIIVPCKNEEGNILKLYKKINDVLSKVKYEILFIDDGSTDNTFSNMKKVYESDKEHIKVISFSRNYKKDAAMLAGLKYSVGEYTCIIDGDLQQNPKLLIEMMDFLDKNKDYDEVSMLMAGRTDNKVMKFLKKIFYKLIDKISNVHFEKDASDFRMFRSNVRDALISLSEKDRFTKGLFSYVGFKVKYIPFSMEKRNSGKTKFGFVSSLKYACNGIVNFSSFPLKVSNFLGGLSIVGALIYLIIACILTKLTISHIILFFLIFMCGLLFILIGILGIYIANIQSEVKDRPCYVIKESLGIDE